MAKSSNQKLKLLYLYKILLEKTDEKHPMTVKEMIEELEKYDIKAERKSIYDDLTLLGDNFGLDIVSVHSKTHGYYVGSRQFELAELKLLVDAVSSSKFITGKKSLSLISKIEKLSSVHDAKSLRRQVFVTDRVKALNEGIYYNVDTIHEAISNNKQITFKYYEWTTDKTKHYRKDGQLYIESPVSLTWDDENYYLIAYKPKYNSFAHYRVDKMESITITDNARVMPENDFDLALYTKKVFSMFSGEQESVDVEFDASLVSVVLDRFGMDVHIRKTDGNKFIAKLNVAISNTFFSWISGFGAKARIVAPQKTKEEYINYLKNILDVY